MLHARKDYDRFQDPEGKIPINEPVFLLRAQDAVAVEVVRFCTKCHRNAGGSEEMAEMAEKHADSMSEWPINEVADL